MVPSINNIVKAQESSQIMKYTMSGSFELQVKRFESVEVTYDVSPRKFFTP